MRYGIQARQAARAALGDDPASVARRYHDIVIAYCNVRKMPRYNDRSEDMKYYVSVTIHGSTETATFTSVDIAAEYAKAITLDALQGDNAEEFSIDFNREGNEYLHGTLEDTDCPRGGGHG